MADMRERESISSPDSGWRGAMDSLLIVHILDSISESLLVLGHEGEVLYANRASQMTLGYGIDELREHGIGLLFFSKEENYEFNQLFVDAIWKKSVNDYSEVDYHHPDGSKRRLTGTTSYLLADEKHESRFVGFVAIFKDITEIHNLRQKEKSWIKERERIARRRSLSLQKLAMGVAHEIRNPVVTIGGFASRIYRGGESPDRVKMLAAGIKESADRLEMMVDSVQRCCNLPNFNPTVADIGRIVSAAAASELMQKAMKRNIAIHVHNSLPPGYRMRVDPVLFRSALKNVLENAVDFSDDGTEVQVFLYSVKGNVVAEVRDEGAGIEEKDLQFIFDPFFSTRTSGPGMGLAVVERVVQEHNGRIEVDSTFGQGTTIRILLPDTRSLPNGL